ncbi:amidohydrolase family protein [Novosphingobium sp. 9U]|uniref:amidohydrolase family protein n=1 Tax=Novosphingobium sp. 9U TaxID=2653158 RepID=UPI0012EF6101|nr:amidohydrolase family protein [Novosphingobium sp. 9U]VWX54603.1 TolB protein, periplasmic protein [Novosphingobium sp. 9U]
MKSHWLGACLAATAIGLATGGAKAQDGALVPPEKAEVVGFDVDEGTSMAVAVSPDGKLLAIDLQGSLWMVPAKGGTARRITDYYNDAHQPVFSPDGKTVVYFAYRDGGFDLWAMNVDGSGRRKLTNGVGDDREPVFSPDGRMIAFASDRTGGTPASYNIWTLDIASGALRQVSHGPEEDRMPTWSPDGTQIAFTALDSHGGELRAVTLVSGEVRTLRKVIGKPDAPSWGPKGQLAYVVSTPSSSTLEIDGQPVSGSENVFPFRVSWLRDGSGYYYVSDGKIRRRAGAKLSTVPFSAHLEVTRPEYVRAKRDFDSTAPRKALGVLNPTISPDGSQIAFVALNDLYVVSSRGGKPTNLTRDLAIDADPAWSPDGKRIVYTSDKGGGLPQLWIRDLASGKDRRLTSLETQPLSAAWSPDGKTIAALDVDGRWGVAGLVKIDVASGAVVRLQPSLTQPGKPSWSADGRYLALSLSQPASASFREGTNQIWVVPADGKEKPFWQVPLPQPSIDTRAGDGPAWSPDGTRMAAVYGGELNIWPVGRQGEGLGPPRVYTKEISYFPTWTADSRTVLYQAADKLKTVDVDTGTTREVPLDLTYVLAKPVGRTVIHAGGLVDAVHDVNQRDKDIVLAGNRIELIADHDAARCTAHFTCVDATGLTAIPGLIEHHAHAQKDFGANLYRAWLAYGITTVRDPGTQPYDGVENREAADSGARLLPRIFSGSPLYEWQRVFYKMGIAVAGPAHLEREIARAEALRYDLLKSYVRMPDVYQRRLVEAAHEMGVPVTTHEVFPAVFTGVDATEHMGATSRRGYSMKQGPQGRSYKDAIQLFNQSRHTVTPTNFGALTNLLAAHPRFRADPRLSLYPTWARETVTKDDGMSRMIGTMIEGQNRAIKALFEGGARITAGTDTMIAINLYAEIASYVDAGLTPFQALQTATILPAQDLNLDAGSLEAGKLADIVLVKGDPREDIAAIYDVQMVIANGRTLEVSKLLGSSRENR